MHIKEGDEVDVVTATRVVTESPADDQRRQALENIRALGWTLPPDYKFDRDEANER